MRNLIDGIDTYFRATPANAFYTAIGGRMYLDTAPHGTSYPYATVSVLSEGQSYVFSGESYREIPVQFNIYSESGSISEAMTTYGHLKTLFDDASFALDSGTLLKFRRVWARPIRDAENGIWQVSVEYEAITEA